MLADQLQVTQGRISKVEMGLLPVSESFAEELAAALDYPTHFFYQEGGILGVGIAEIFHRKRQDVAKRVLTKVYAQIDLRFRHVAALLRATDVPQDLQRLDLDEYGGNVEQIARLVRSSWKLSRGPVPSLIRALEDRGVIVIPCDFETRKIDAISRWVPGYPPLIFVNNEIPTDRRRFSVAHELGHLIMHERPNPDIETQANRFAAEFLMPEDDIRADLADLKLSRLPVLKRYWRVAMSALVRRAHDLSVITDNQNRYLCMKLAEAGYKTREPIELDLAGEEPSLLRELIDVHRKDLGYSVDDLSEILALNAAELQDLYFSDRGMGRLKAIPGSGPRKMVTPSNDWEPHVVDR